MSLISLQFNLALLRGEHGTEAERDAEWLKVFRHFQPRLVSYFANRCDSADDLDDLLANLWTRAFLHVESLRASEAIWSWLTTIANNLLRDAYRGSQRRESKHLDIDLAEGDLQSVLSKLSVDGFDAAHPIDISWLTEEEHEFLSLYFVDGLTHQEISDHLGLDSAAASRQRLRRIRVRFTQHRYQN